MCSSVAAIVDCHPVLWPVDSAIMNPVFSIPPETLLDLQQWSQKLVYQHSNAVSVLASSGKTDINDPALLASREAFKDADRAAVLALTYRLTNNIDYFNKTAEILLSWSKINHPTGNPIDETRLDGMIWAYDLIACDLSTHDKTKILRWFERLRQKKIAWTFGGITSTNNYRIHQLKILLMLDKVLGRQKDWNNDLVNAEKYSLININPQSGVSLDYLERSALYYHNFVMQPWLEISLLTRCCRQPVKRAFTFLSDKILSNDIDDEFSDSQAEIDILRADGGFVYAKKGGTFDVTKAQPTIVMYYTMVRTNPEPNLWSIQQQTKPSPWMAFLVARRLLWQPGESP